MWGFRWVITPSWLSGLWRWFLYSSSVYSSHLFLISSASVRSKPFIVLYWAYFCMKYSLGIFNFLEEVFSLSHSIVFLYFFTLITEEGFFISPCYSFELCIHMGISFVFSFAFRNPGSIPGLGRSPGEENGNPLQYSCLENPMDRETGRLQSIGLQRVRHNRNDSAHTAHQYWHGTGSLPLSKFFLNLMPF